jgi:anti-anti-sigma factor
MVVTEASQRRVVLSGRLDVQSVSEVRFALHEAIDAGAGDVAVDVGGVDLIDATGLGVLVGAHRRARQRGTRLVLVNVNERMNRVLRLTRLHRILVVA